MIILCTLVFGFLILNFSFVDFKVIIVSPKSYATIPFKDSDIFKLIKPSILKKLLSP